MANIAFIKVFMTYFSASSHHFQDINISKLWPWKKNVSQGHEVQHSQWCPSMTNIRLYNCCISCCCEPLPGRTFTCTVGTKRSWPWPRRRVALFPAGARGSTKSKFISGFSAGSGGIPSFHFRSKSVYCSKTRYWRKHIFFFFYLQQKQTKVN